MQYLYEWKRRGGRSGNSIWMVRLVVMGCASERVGYSACAVNGYAICGVEKSCAARRCSWVDLIGSCEAQRVFIGHSYHSQHDIFACTVEARSIMLSTSFHRLSALLMLHSLCLQNLPKCHTFTPPSTVATSQCPAITISLIFLAHG